MPKIFLMDLGLRNSLLKNFDLVSDRFDRGELLENLFFKLLSDKNESLFFWRTQQQQEVDFILPLEKKVIEIKWNKNKESLKSKKAFLKFYSEFEYKVLSFTDGLHF